jgi:FAD binding domain
MYDAIVVGARCAGSPTAMLLARLGYRVLLVDKATFPGDTLSSHFIRMPGVGRLKRWGVLDRIIASKSPPIATMSLDLGPFTLVGMPPAVEDVATLYAPRRTVLDKILLGAAMVVGAEVREGFFVPRCGTACRGHRCLTYHYALGPQAAGSLAPGGTGGDPGMSATGLAGTKSQNWHFVAVTDPEPRQALTRLYGQGAAQYMEVMSPMLQQPMASSEQETRTLAGVIDSGAIPD